LAVNQKMLKRDAKTNADQYFMWQPLQQQCKQM